MRGFLETEVSRDIYSAYMTPIYSIKLIGKMRSCISSTNPPRAEQVANYSRRVILVRRYVP